MGKLSTRMYDKDLKPRTELLFLQTYTYIPCYLINGKPILLVAQVKILGVIFDASFSHAAH